MSEKLKVDPKKSNQSIIKSSTRRLPAAVTNEDRSASDPAEKAALVNTFFSTVYGSNAILSEDLDDDVVHPNLLMEISTTQEEVEDIFLKLNVYKASGVDGISACILKIYAKELPWPLTHLFNLSFTLGEAPLIWKRANITPVFKANAKESLEKYRLISLLSILGKFQERIVHRVIYSHVSQFLNNWQHGKGRSCITQLVLLHHTWHKTLDNRVFRFMRCFWTSQKPSTVCITRYC